MQCITIKIVLDPRATKLKYSPLKKRLVLKGLDDNKVTQPDLYKLIATLPLL